MRSLRMASCKEVITHDYAKRRQTPQPGEQLVRTIRLGHGCGNHRNCPCIAIRLVVSRCALIGFGLKPQPWNPMLFDLK
jgi:hypothetical protein